MGAQPLWLLHAHRAVRPNWLNEEGRLTNKAFRRTQTDTDGLSVACSHESAKLLQRNGKGVAALEISSVEDYGLPVVRSEGVHGFIDGVPYDTPENYNRAMQVADKLVELSDLTPDHWRRRD